VLGLGLASCARCSTTTPDAGAPVPDAGPAHVKRSTDLRTAMLVAFPEYRGVDVVDGYATLTRRYVSLPADALAKSNQGNGFTAMEDGGLFRAPFVLSRAGPDTLVLTLPVDTTVVEKVQTAPMALSSMEMGLYLPRGLPVAEEHYEFYLHYRALPAKRASFLTRQVVELLSRNSQWKAGPLPEDWGADPGDGGFGTVPERFTVTLDESMSGAHVTLSRDGADVWVRYEVVTDAPAP
jgi:hypothetical protein